MAHDGQIQVLDPPREPLVEGHGDKAELYARSKRIIEGLLFASSDPVSLRRLCHVLELHHPLAPEEVKSLLEELRDEYEALDRSFALEEIGKGYILRSKQEYAPYIQALLKTARPERLSQAACEVLSIIAYRQPVTRPQIDEIRGVDSSGIVHTLLDRQLIECVGKMEVPGRPALYGVTMQFLKHFGLKDVKELTKITGEIKSPQKLRAKDELRGPFSLPTQENKPVTASEGQIAPPQNLQ